MVATSDRRGREGGHSDHSNGRQPPEAAHVDQPPEDATEQPSASAEEENRCWDVIIVGGGPAGLSAALTLARVRRQVLVFDSGSPRNEASLIQHNILGADGANRKEFLDNARKQVLAYPEVRFESLEVTEVDIKAVQVEKCKDDSETRHTSLNNGLAVRETAKFRVYTQDGRTWRSKKLVLATGVRDHVPGVPGLSDYWGKGVWVCLYCDGYEYRDQRVAAMGNGQRGVHLALEMLQCTSRDLVLLTDGEPLEATQLERQVLCRHGVQVYEQPLRRAYGGADGQLAGVELEDGQRVPLKALFFNTGRCQHSPLPRRMGLRSNDRGDLVADDRGDVASVHGLYVAGNMAEAPLKLVMTAAAQGAATGAKVNSELFYEELGLEGDTGERYPEPYCAHRLQHSTRPQGGDGEKKHQVAAERANSEDASNIIISTRKED